MLAINCFQVEHLQVLRYAGPAPAAAVLLLFGLVCLYPFLAFAALRLSAWWLLVAGLDCFLCGLIFLYLLRVSEHY